MGYEWAEEEEEAIEVEAVVGKVVAEGQTAYADKGRVAAGIVFYRISLAADAAADDASAREDAERINLEESKRMPAA
eukprot:6201925-Pleurochrysis_carterae.AAC.10